MKRWWILAAAARGVVSNPLPEQSMGAADPPSGIGTGVTIAIAPPGGTARGCSGNWNGPAFGIAAVPVRVQRNADGGDSTPSADQPLPKFTLAPSAADSQMNMADHDMPAVTQKPAVRLINGDARLAATGTELDSDVTVTSYSTRTRTKTVTLKSVGAPSSAAVASPTAMDLSGLKTIKAAQLYQIGDGQVQALPSPSPIPLKPVPTPTAGSASPTPYAPLPQGAPRISQIGDGQIQAPTGAAAPLAAPAAAVPGLNKNSKGKGQKGNKQPAQPAPVLAEASVDSFAVPADAVMAPSDALVAPEAALADAIIAAEVGSSPAADQSIGDMESHTLMKRQSGGGRTGGYGCKNKDGSTLEMTLRNGVLTDNKGRTGYVADNRQFQFDAPPQAGAQVTAGWGICDDGFLALGPSKVFYQCLSGSFYNIYDRNIAAQCNPINLIALENRSC